MVQIKYLSVLPRATWKCVNENKNKTMDKIDQSIHSYQIPIFIGIEAVKSEAKAKINSRRLCICDTKHFMI